MHDSGAQLPPRTSATTSPLRLILRLTMQVCLTLKLRPRRVSTAKVHTGPQRDSAQAQKVGCPPPLESIRSTHRLLARCCTLEELRAEHCCSDDRDWCCSAAHSLFAEVSGRSKGPTVTGRKVVQSKLTTSTACRRGESGCTTPSIRSLERDRHRWRPVDVRCRRAKSSLISLLQTVVKGYKSREASSAFG